MDYGKALTFFQEDEHWQEKVAIGVGVFLLSTLLGFALIGIIGYLIVTGYSLRLMENVRRGDPRPLPEWDQWGEDLVRGFKLAVVTFVWALPAILLSIPLAIGSAMADGGSGAGEFFGVSIILCGTCLLILYAFFVTVAQPGFTLAFMRDERISSGLEFTAVWRWVRAHLGETIIVALVIVLFSLLIMIAASVVGVILCIVGLLVTLPLAGFAIYIFQYHLYGQLGRMEPAVEGAAGARMLPAVFSDVAPAAPAEPAPPAAPPADLTPPSEDDTPTSQLG